ncbi:MAG: hypothetical protein RSF40_01665 [Oscillospiraceae bacterium]
MNQYTTLKEKHQEEVNNFPMFFAFSNNQFDDGMKKLGLQPSEIDKVCSIGCGGYIRKTDGDSMTKMYRRHKKECREAIANDTTGEGYIYDMFRYELDNHEYCITCYDGDALDALGVTHEQVEADERMIKALSKAKKDIGDWYRDFG